MATADVELVVGDVGAGNVAGDDGEGVGAVGSWGLRDVLAAEQYCRGHGIDICGCAAILDGDGRLHGPELEFDVKNGRVSEAKVSVCREVENPSSETVTE